MDEQPRKAGAFFNSPGPFLVVGALALLFNAVVAAWLLSGGGADETSNHLGGQFVFFGPERPEALGLSHCLTGSELGFEGVEIYFSKDDPVRRLRVDTSTRGAWRISVTYDTSRPKVALQQSECREVSGRVGQKPLDIGGRTVARLEGFLHVDCPQARLRGDAFFRGCLPSFQPSGAPGPR